MAIRPLRPLRPLSPLLRLTLALVSICAMLVLMADAFLDVFPSRSAQLLAQRTQLGNQVAVQVASLLRRADTNELRLTLDELRTRLPKVQALVLRRANGSVLAQAGVPTAAPGATSATAEARPGEAEQAGAEQGGQTLTPEQRDSGSELSTVDHVLVPLVSAGRRWGRLELRFETDSRPLLLRWLTEPLVATLLLVLGGGAAMFGLYLRRALQHLDPRSVIPERVQGAFDVMNDSVVVLDGQGRVLLANQAFRAVHPDAAQVKVGQAMSAQQWLISGLPGRLDDHPWHRTLRGGGAVSGQSVQVARPDGVAQQLLINTMPINDMGGKVRGCLISMTDLSELHKAHADLHVAMAELSASKEQVQQQNAELLRLATRDPMTGCLNRRAFNQAFEPLFDQAMRDHTALSCLVLDIDFFKKVNDTHGHGIGDRVIQEVARKLADSARAADLVCRWGGEEFVVLLPGLDAEGACQVGERVRLRIADECGPAVREVPGMRVTVSLGVATCRPGLAKPGDLIDAADQGLYRAKRGGRNRVVHEQAPESVPEAVA